MSFPGILSRVRCAAALIVTAGCFSASWSAFAQVSVRPSVRVVQKVDGSVVTAIAGTHPAVVDHALVGSRVASATTFKHMILVLQSSDDQEYALRGLLDAQQDKNSASYHKWLTPGTFAQSFGVAPSDVTTVTSWLRDSGMTVDSVAKSNRYIVFSGTSGAVEAAFHTQMNHVTVDGEAHISNTTDISIPSALAAVVHGVASLNDFAPKANIVNPHKAVIPKAQTVDAASTNPSPNYTSTSSGAHYVTPGDAAVIFNSNPLLNQGIDGTGVSIAVLGRTNITVSDVQQFRSMFGLKKMDPTITVIGNDPGINTDDIEAYLDVEWAGGLAPGASVNFVIGGTNYFTNGGIADAGLYAVDNNLADIITLSYGGCETSNGASGTAFWNTLWEQAASQGQSAFISTGDSDATGCSSSSAAYGTAYGVNGLGSSAYNVAVGGSMFVDFGPSQYWAAGVAAPAPSGYNFVTALSYIPEATWNEGALSTTYLNTLSTATQPGSGISGGGGGISIYTARPTWQTGSGISATADSPCSTGTCIAAGSPITGVHRLVPDISFIAASGHAATVFCAEGSCNDTSTGYGIGAVGGTSVATPVMAGVQALINQRNGGRQGNPNFHYYPLANADYVSGVCKAVNGTAANPTVTLPASTCNFHDIVAGSNRAPQNAADTTGLGFDSATGFDAASGLGSVNITNVATNWSTVSFRATTTSFTLSPTAGISHGASQLFTATVAATSGTGTPTGDVSIIAETANPGTLQRYTLTSGAYSGSISGLPGGSYNVHVHYAGDGNFAASDSPSVAVNIGTESSTLALSVSDFYPGFVQSGVTTVPYGYLVDVIATAAGTSATGIPTGTTTFQITQNGNTLPSYTGTVDATGTVSLIAGASYTSLYIAPNYPSLAPGAYTITATYSGDKSFTTSTATANLTVAKLTPTGTLTSSSAYILSASTVTLNYTVARVTSSTFPTLAAYPSGSVTFTDTTSGTVLGTSTLSATGVATLQTSAIITPGANAISAVYTGDNNYAGITSTGSVTVGVLTPTVTTLSVAAGTYYVGTAAVLTATVTPAVAGTVYFYDGSTLLGSAKSSATTGIATGSTTALTAGAHLLQATFTGTTTYAASTGTTALTVQQNVTTSVIEAPFTSTYGQAIIMNGRVNRSPSVATPVVPLTGTVTFMDGNTTIGTATPVYLPGGYAAYTATFSTVTLGAGSHTLSATYSGDANYATSTSSTVTTTIAQLTPAITLSSGSTVYTVNSSIPLTAKLAIPNTLSAPTAGVTFYDGSTTLGTVTPTYSAAAGSYIASYTATGLARGPHNLTAAYAGDTNYAASAGTLALLIATNNVWVANGNGSVSALASNGAAFTPVAVTGGGTAIAIDNSGNVWSLNKSANSVAEFSRAGAVINSGYTGAGIAAPSALTIDGSGIVWIANADGTLSGLTSTGAPVSSTAYTVGTSSPTSVVVDGSGNLWFTNQGDNSVTQVIGVASPVLTPTTTAVKTNNLAVKP